MEETKRCTKCGIVKPLSAFYKDSTKKDGFRNDCKTCVSERGKDYYKANRIADYVQNSDLLQEQSRGLFKNSTGVQ